MTVKRLLLWFGILACIITLIGWLRIRPSNFTNLPPTATGPWIAFGDSLTEGVGAGPGHDYPTILGAMLGIDIVNLGRSGNTTADGLARVEAITSQNPRVVLLCLGGNDSLNGVPRSQTFGNLSAIIDRLHSAGSLVVLIGVRSASLRDRFDKDFAKLATEKNVFHIPDILKGVVFKPVYMADAIHPNEAGYQRIAGRLAGELKPLLPRLNAIPASP